MQVELIALILSVIFTFLCAYIVLFVSAGMVVLFLPAVVLLYGVAYAAYVSERGQGKEYGSDHRRIEPVEHEIQVV